MVCIKWFSFKTGKHKVVYSKGKHI